jgi:hypothetical protein
LTSPTGTWTQILIVSSVSALISPVTTWRTAPLFFGLEPGGLCLLEDRRPGVGGLDERGVEGEGAGGVGRVDVDAGHLEVLQPQLLGGTELVVRVADRRDQTGRSADVRERVDGVDAQVLEVVDVEASLQLGVRRGLPGVHPDDAHRRGAGDLVELVGEHLVVAAARVMQEGDVAGVPGGTQRAQHRHDRRDARAAADQQQGGRDLAGEHELALGLRQVDDRAGRELLVQELRHVAVGVGLDRDAERPGATLDGTRARHREHADAAGAVDLDAELHVLAGLEALPGAVGAHDDGAGLAGLTVHLDHAGADVAGREHGVHLLEVVVDRVGGGQRADGSRRQGRADDAHAWPPETQ